MRYPVCVGHYRVTASSAPGGSRQASRGALIRRARLGLYQDRWAQQVFNPDPRQTGRYAGDRFGPGW